MSVVLFISCPTASYDSLFYGRYPHGDKPAGATLAGAAVDSTSATAAFPGSGSNILTVLFPQNVPLAAGTPAAFTLSFYGSSNAAASWSITSGATGDAAIDNTGYFTWTPAAGGNQTMTFEVFDTAGNFGTGNITWAVAGYQYKFNPGDYMESVNLNGTGSGNQAEMNLLAAGASTATGVSGYMANYMWPQLEPTQGSYATGFANIASDYNYLQSKNPGSRFMLGILSDYNNPVLNSALPTHTYSNQIVPNYILNCGGTLNVYNTATYPTSSGATTAYTLAAQVNGQYGFGMSDYDGSTKYIIGASALWDPGVNAAWINLWKALAQYKLQWTTASGGDNNYYTLDTHPLVEFMRNGNEISYNFDQGPYTPAYTSSGNRCTVTNYWTQFLLWARAATAAFPHTMIGVSPTYGVIGEDGSSDSVTAFNTSSGWLSSSNLGGIQGLVLCNSDTWGANWSSTYNTQTHAQAQNGLQAFIGIQTTTAEANVTLPTPTNTSLQGVMPIFCQVQSPDHDRRMVATASHGASFYFNTAGGVLQIMNAANGTTAPSSSTYTMGASHGLWCSAADPDYSIADWGSYIQSTFSTNRGTYPLNTTRPSNLP